METKSRRPDGRSTPHDTVYQVKCDHPATAGLKEYGVNVFLFVGRTAEVDARIRALELEAAGMAGVKIHRQEYRREPVAGSRAPRDRFAWREVG